VLACSRTPSRWRWTGVFASGYRVQLERVPYLETLIGDIELAEGFPVLDEGLGASISRLYLTGFSATRDFGPFFGFVEAAPTSATLVVRDPLSRN
jgi:FAD-dependent urate hydroxylase